MKKKNRPFAYEQGYTEYFKIPPNSFFIEPAPNDMGLNKALKHKFKKEEK